MVCMSDCGELLQELVKLAKVCPPLADIEVSRGTHYITVVSPHLW